MMIYPKDRSCVGYISINNLSTSQKNYKNFFLAVLLISALIVGSLPFINFSSIESKKFHKIKLDIVNHPPIVSLKRSNNVENPRNTQCTHWDCFNIYHCGHTGHDRISVYVYPLEKYVDENGVPAVESVSNEYYSLVKSIVESKYYTANPEEACVFVPFLDTLNEDRIDLNLTSTVLNQLPS